MNMREIRRFLRIARSAGPSSRDGNDFDIKGNNFEQKAKINYQNFCERKFGFR